MIVWNDLPELEREQVMLVAQAGLDAVRERGFVPGADQEFARGVVGSLAYGCKDNFFDYDFVVFFRGQMPNGFDVREFNWIKRRGVQRALRQTGLDRKMDLYLLSVHDAFLRQNKVPFFHDVLRDRTFTLPEELINDGY